MICPDCSNDTLFVRYTTMPGSFTLDGSACPLRKVPLELLCPHCGNGYFIMQNESIEEAYDRIAPDITRSMYLARRKCPDCQ